LSNEQSHRVDATAKIDEAAVSVVVDQETRKPLGSGFYFLRPNFFVTAKHVVVDRVTGAVRRDLVLMQSAPDYPALQAAFLHPSLDIAVMRVDRPRCEIPLFPSDQRLSGGQGLRFWGYSPSRSDKAAGRYAVLVVDVPSYSVESPRERSDSVEHTIHLPTDLAEGGFSGGPVLGLGGGVVALITEGTPGGVRATEIRALLPYLTFQF
jgi:hypothetical protein